jgi:hypothetical protein
LAARIFAHLARCAAAIRFLPAAEILRLGADPTNFATTGCDPFRILAHRAFCASAIFRRDAADMIRFGWVVLLGTGDDPFKDSIPEIIWSN